MESSGFKAGMLLLLLALMLWPRAVRGGEYMYDATDLARDRALEALEERLEEEARFLYVYKDFGDTENHFTQKARVPAEDAGPVVDLDENCQDSPLLGDSCIRCNGRVPEGEEAGWLFLNGFLPSMTKSARKPDLMRPLMFSSKLARALWIV